MMLTVIRRRRLEAKALSVLQTAYAMSLSQPLSAIDARILRQVSAEMMVVGGNGVDAATAFMIKRARSALEAELANNRRVIVRVRADLTQLECGILQVAAQAKLRSPVFNTMREVRLLRALADERDSR